MSSTAQAISSTSNFQLIIDALADYAKITGIDLSKSPFAATLEQSSSPEAILQLLQGRVKAFKEYRDGSRRLINCLSPAVKIFRAFSGILGEAVNLVSYTYHLVSFFNVALSDPLPTCKRIVCCDRCSPCCTSSNMPFGSSPLMYEYARLPVGFRRATTPYLISLSAWRTSSNVWRSIRRSRPLR
jgi:fungal STAND N-terminal Goodbye domain